MSAPTSLESGRYNVISSFNKWVQDNVASLSPLPAPAGMTTGDIPFSVQFDRPVKVEDISTGPVVAVTDLGLFSPAAADVDDVMVAGVPEDFRGKLSQTLIEVVIWHSQRVQTDADARIRRVRDAFVGAYMNSGRKNSAGVVAVPAILIYDFAGSDLSNPTPTNNYIRKDRQASWFTESMLEDRDHEEMRGWRGLLRIWWIEFYNAA